ncbi:hypothetical protein M885DRAFT_494873 [Pelagophyceae sp. CCMP2097]|nr:hypothetical protein M885DRAFT_494873 [Pelagophyceae sp. CCMP2097]
MGARGSTLQGRADVEPRVRGFTAYDTKEIDELLLRHKHDLGGRLALGPKHAKVLLGLDPNTAASIFADVFDTDRNKLVDAFELISALILVSRLGAPQKIRCVHALFDFNGTGDLNLDELTILLRTVAAGCGKVDRNVVPPTMLEFERMTKWAFLKAKREEDEEIAFVEFERFVLTEPTIRALLDYFTEGASEVALEPGTLWFDGGVPLFRDAARPPPGLPRQAGVVTLQRPGEFFKLGASTPKLFTSETNYGQIVEGALSEAWLLSALAILMTRREAVRRIFSKTGQEARGRYAVNLWRGGQSSVVFVDDLFPIFASGDRFFARSTDASELWVMLVEKAWAKVLGSYEALGDGNVSVDEALHALTGGPAHARRDVATCAGDDLWRNLGLWLEQGVCGFSSETNSGADGLLKGRCYGVLRIVDHAGAKLVGRGFAELDGGCGFGLRL